MKASLLNFRMRDGSRQFAELSEACSWAEFHQHIERLAGATITEYVADDVTEMWLDFSFRGHAFTVNNQNGDYLFFVRDPSCPDHALTTIVEHCESILGR
jgi:hypothetical protein